MFLSSKKYNRLGWDGNRLQGFLKDRTLLVEVLSEHRELPRGFFARCRSIDAAVRASSALLK